MNNKLIKEKNKIKQFKIVIFIVLFIIIISSVLLLIFKNLNFSSLMGNSSTINDNNRISIYPEYSMSTSGSNSNALQGSAGYYNGKDFNIIFGTTASGSNKKSNYYSTIKQYNLSNDNLIPMNLLNNTVNEKYPQYKNNDIVLNTSENRLYYLYFDGKGNYKNSYILANKGGGIYTVNTGNYYFTNIGYSSSWKKFVSLYKNKIYFYTLDNDTINVKKVCNISNIVGNPKENESITFQGITVSGKLLYVAYQKKAKDTSDNTIKYNNYIDLYDMRNCLVGDKKVKLNKTYDLGYDSNKYELESMFFMNKKLYLGYNNSNFNNISFYTYNLSNTSTLTGNVVTKNNVNYLVGNVINNNNGVYAYSFCNSKKRNECKFKSLAKNNQYLINFDNQFNISKKINDEKGTYYFHIVDNFNNHIVSDPIEV